jgi:hypothetical protein
MTAGSPPRPRWSPWQRCRDPAGCRRPATHYAVVEGAERPLCFAHAAVREAGGENITGTLFAGKLATWDASVASSKPRLQRPSGSACITSPRMPWLCSRSICTSGMTHEAGDIANTIAFYAFNKR